MTSQHLPLLSTFPELTFYTYKVTGNDIINFILSLCRGRKVLDKKTQAFFIDTKCYFLQGGAPTG